ncbi:hypothetical protein BKX96_24905 [Pseudomonas putida]|nr:hypothetical protein BKX96_24905 [Pseudomonas putida]
MHPGRQVRIEAVINPLALTAIQQQPAAAQLREMAADLRLAVVQRAHQLADTQLALVGDQQGGAGTGLVSQAFEYLGRRDHWVGPIYG